VAVAAQLDKLLAQADQAVVHQDKDTQGALHCNLVMVQETMVVRVQTALGLVDPLEVAVAAVQLIQGQMLVVAEAEMADLVLTLLAIC
jgi:hypothetical protein